MSVTIVTVYVKSSLSVDNVCTGPIWNISISTHEWKYFVIQEIPERLREKNSSISSLQNSF